MTASSSDKTKKHVSAAGFTLLELLISMILALFMMALVLQFTFDFWGSMGSLASDSATLVERENAGDRLRDLLNSASKLINQNSINDANPLVSADSTHWLYIHAHPQTIAMPASGSYTPVFYYDAPSVNSSKGFIMNGSQPYYDEFILYLDGSSNQLMLRSLANPSASGDIVTTTCPPASATATCPADAIISSDLTSVDVNYYSRSGNVIDYESSVDPLTNEYNGPDFSEVEVVQLTLHYSRRATINGAAVSTSQTVVRVALRN